MTPEETASWADEILAGNRRALARAITLIESTRPAHRDDADILLEKLLPHTGNSMRLGISGAPGVGKSTFIEAFGQYAIGQGKKPAVLAVDPSSQISGGSILGDKTRMEQLSRHAQAFIRPSPAGHSLGGVARRTREAILLCEAAGFDLILVETVGVGQSETAVADMTDLFILLLLPGGGDELQGIKKGIVELADMIVVNKADGALENIARASARDYRNALNLLRPSGDNWLRPSGDNWKVPVETCSALQQTDIDTVWQQVQAFQEKGGAHDTITAKRVRQAKAWLWTEISEGLLAQLRRDPATAAAVAKSENRIASGQESPVTASRKLLSLFLSNIKK